MHAFYRNSLLLLILIAFFLGGKAQRINVETAIDDIGDGDHADALKYIKRAQKHDETKNKARTWFYTAKILTEIATHKDTSVRNLAEDPVQGALDAIEKCKELDKEEDYKRKLAGLEAQLSGIFFQTASEALKKKDYSKSYKYFRRAGMSRYRQVMKSLPILIRKHEDVTNKREAFEKLKKEGKLDTITFTAFYYAGVSADQLKREHKDSAALDSAALRMYSLASQSGFRQGDAIEGAARVLLRMGDDQRFLRLVQEGLKNYPEHSGLLRLRSSYYIRNGELKKAEKSLKKAVEKDPDNMALRVILGSIYQDFYNDLAKDSLGLDTLSAEDSTQLSKEYYNKAKENFALVLKNDSGQAEALCGLGKLHFERGVDYMRTAQSMKKENKEERKKVWKKAKDHWAIAAPLFEKLLKIKMNVQAARALLTIYSKTDQDKKWKRIRSTYFK